MKVEIPVVGEREIKDCCCRGWFGPSPLGGQDIAEWAVPNDADYIALSFVQTLDLIYVWNFWTMLTDIHQG